MGIARREAARRPAGTYDLLEASEIRREFEGLTGDEMRWEGGRPKEFLWDEGNSPPVPLALGGSTGGGRRQDQDWQRAHHRHGEPGASSGRGLS